MSQSKSKAELELLGLVKEQYKAQTELGQYGYFDSLPFCLGVGSGPASGVEKMGRI